MLEGFQLKQPQHEALTVAVVKGLPIVDLPKDLYIPPDALRVFLEIFEGPLDLLLYLIKNQDLDILNLPVAKITDQYMAYIALMEGLRFELAAEYLLMAAMLAEIKSKFLLPQNNLHEEGSEPEDPRAELIRRLQAYEQIKHTAVQLDTLARMDRDFFSISVKLPDVTAPQPWSDVTLNELVHVLREVMQRAKLTSHYSVKSETLSLRERMSDILARLTEGHYTEFSLLFNVEEGVSGVVLSFIAILELARQQLIEVLQVEAYSSIHVRSC